MSHISDPQFLVVHEYIHMSLQGVCLCSRGFLSGVFLSGRSCPGWFLSVPFLSEYMYIRYNMKLNITFNFRFYMYKTFFKSMTSHALRHLPLSQTVPPTRPPSPRAWRTLW